MNTKELPQLLESLPAGTVVSTKNEIRHPNGAYQRLGCGYDWQLEVGRHLDARRHFVKIVGRVAGAAAVAGLVGWWCLQAWGLSGLLKVAGVQ